MYELKNGSYELDEMTCMDECYGPKKDDYCCAIVGLTNDYLADYQYHCIYKKVADVNMLLSLDDFEVSMVCNSGTFGGARLLVASVSMLLLSVYLL